jgi:hypothetical protein
MTTTLIGLLALCLASLPVSALVQEAGLGIIYGTDHAFSLTAPKGWMLDNESGVQQGIHAVFYPKGKTWKNSPVIAYARSRPRTKKIQTTEDVVKDVVAMFHREGSPNYKAKKDGTITTASGKKADIYIYTGDEWGNSEAVAYFVEKKTINFVVYNSPKADDFRKSLDSFKTLAKSYTFMGDAPLKKGRRFSAVIHSLPYEKEYLI